MKLILLGTASGIPTPGKNHSAILLSSYKANLLLDCGESAARSMAEKQIPPDYLDFIAISHFHPDHICGIFMVLQLFHIANRKKKLLLYLPENETEFIKTLDMFYLFPGKLPYILKIKNLSLLDRDYDFIKTAVTDHLIPYKDFVTRHKMPNKLKSFAFIINGDNRNVLYTSDLSNVRDLKEHIKEVDLIIIDALHPDADQIVEVIETGKNVILTHGISNQLQKIIITRNYPNVIIADDNQEIIV